MQLLDGHLNASRWEDARLLAHKLLKLAPGNPEYLFRMGVAVNGLGQAQEAAEWLGKAIAQDPGNADYHFTQALLWVNANQFDKAIAAYGHAIAHRPTFAQAHSNLGDALSKQNRFDEAIASYHQAIALMPQAGQIHSNLGLALQRVGRMAEALACFDQALTLEPGLIVAASNGLMASLYYHGYTAEQVFARHLAFAQRFEAPLKANWRPHTNDRSPQRRLRLGYVSADLRAHPVANFFEPIFMRHDKSRFEVFVYSNNAYRDAVTERFAAAADHWRACGPWSDVQLANAIRADQIDLLVDLSGHTAGNRLLALARKPAPVQVTWIGYPNTTGLAAMDYRLTDDNLDPPGLTDAFHTERLVRLPSLFPFQPAPESPPVTPLPALAAPVFTLACLNNMAKVNEAVVAVWSRLLLALPQARLLLGNAGNHSTQRWLLALFAAQGIGPERLSLRAKLGMAQYLALHGEIDLMLDPFPYTGGTSTMHSLWMGVPVVTLAGDRSASRQGASALSMVGLPEFIAKNEQEYIDTVLHWAADPDALNRLRQDLRQRMAAIQDDPGRFTRAVEQALADMWARWCEFPAD